MMKSYQSKFIELALAASALKFGQFTLKSGRVSPYFFNAGEFHTGAQLATLGHCYAAALAGSDLGFDMLFGPAYKGIPLASATAIALAEEFNRDLPYAFNRKEAKAHGEGGSIVGAPLQGRIAVVDDVITAGTAIREVIDIVDQQGAEVTCIVVGLDRQERGRGASSAIQELQDMYQIPVISIVTLGQIVQYLRQQGESQYLEQIESYRERYGVVDV